MIRFCSGAEERRAAASEAEKQAPRGGLENGEESVELRMKNKGINHSDRAALGGKGSVSSRWVPVSSVFPVFPVFPVKRCTQKLRNKSSKKFQLRETREATPPLALPPLIG
ncbi:hypothetical protein CgunFtcFv8_005929 [Champsocephalus gunnari]|uniref:Uncharacterized protein n=1 Tax=Champsocephalus gunnari TaxID=52237 RepID=A0AAN8GWF5_CHAGU|nr:hypothetical protein CgunFtcFv8_005929 [Champsocephalus gunnari]